MSEDIPPYFTKTGGHYTPAPHARSWWTAGMLHGRLLGGLMARTLENEHRADGFHFARLTVDLFRNAPFEPVAVSTESLRDGRRIRVTEAKVTASTGVVARATAVQLRIGEQPEERPAPAPDWDVPRPESLAERKPGNALQQWFIPGDGRTTPRGLWMREACELVAGEALSPFVRAALAADAASPMAHRSETGLAFINADYSLYLSRPPVGEYLGLESGGHASTDGVAVGQCALYDEAGHLGWCATAAVANPRRG